MLCSDLSSNQLAAVEVSAWSQVAQLRNLSLAENRFKSLPSGKASDQSAFHLVY